MQAGYPPACCWVCSCVRPSKVQRAILILPRIWHPLKVHSDDLIGDQNVGNSLMFGFA
jgi:hypothetical protein